MPTGFPNRHPKESPMLCRSPAEVGLAWATHEWIEKLGRIGAAELSQ